MVSSALADLLGRDAQGAGLVAVDGDRQARRGRLVVGEDAGVSRGCPRGRARIGFDHLASCSYSLPEAIMLHDVAAAAAAAAAALEWRRAPRPWPATPVISAGLAVELGGDLVGRSCPARSSGTSCQMPLPVLNWLVGRSAGR